MNTSPSAVEKAGECLRIWAHGYVHGNWAPQNQAGAEGEDGHGQIENFIRYKIKFDDTPIGRAAALGIPYFPNMKADQPVLETPVDVTYGDHTFRKMKIDAMWLSMSGPIVMDHKFKDAFKRLHTKNTLRVDLPACVYAYYAMKRYESDIATLRWVYYKKTEPVDIKVLEVVVDMDDVSRVLRERHGFINTMADIQKRKLPIAEIPASPERCMKYGEKYPCHYIKDCFPDGDRVGAGR